MGVLQVWFYFKFLETIGSVTCIYFHLKNIGLSDVEDIPHFLFLCGTFYGFMILNLMSMVSFVFPGWAPSNFMEAVWNFLAAAFHFLAAIIAMHGVERDYHLNFLGNLEEFEHAYLQYSVRQSLAALVLGSLFLYHALCAADAALIPPDEPSDDDTTEEESGQQVGTPENPNPIQLYMMGKWMHQQLNRSQWIRRLGHKKYKPPVQRPDFALMH